MLLSAPLVRTAFLVTIAAAIPHIAFAQPGRVNGLVNDQNGRPLKAATVMAENYDFGQTFTATTDDKGRFVMIGLRSGQWGFIAQAPGYEPQGSAMLVRANPNPPIVFGLPKRPGPSGLLANVAAKDLQADLAAADALFSQKRWDEAAAAYRSIAEKEPALAVVKLQIAAAYRNKKDYDAAVAAYSELLRTDANNGKATVGIAVVQMERGNQRAAEEALLKGAAAPGAGRELFDMLGDLKFQKGDIDEASRWYQKASEADPSWGKPLYKLGLCALRRGDRPTAAGLMAKVVAVDPGSPEAALAKTSIDLPR